jgi:non-specific serine/threonine protein kinase
LWDPEHLFQVVQPDLAADFPPLKSLDARPNNLPIQLTSFIGREREKAEVGRLLITDRLVTLTGAGGAGKTRLALQVAAEGIEEFPDGVWLVELAALSSPDLVPKAVASALGVPEQLARSLTETLRDALRAKSVLVILDNCEHLVEACAQLADALLRTCTNLRILATSREALGVTGETTWRVPSLPVPDPQHLPPVDRFKEYDAVRLFMERAVVSDPQFAMTTSNAPAVAQVCHRLDGIPLALELAAARVRVLAVEQIAARLDDRFRLLTGGSRTAVLRHQTLRATMDWSFDLLSQEERALLRRLSVFAGGWTLEAAEAICSGNGVDASDTLDLLTQLVDKSLVITETQGGEARSRLLETVRQYGWERLLEAGEADDVRRRHCEWYLDLAEQADPKLRGNEQELWLERLATEHDNLRTALAWGRTDAQSAEAWLRLVRALHYFWIVTEHMTEGRRWLEEALTRGNEADPVILLGILIGAGRLAYRQGDYERAGQLAEQALVLSRTLKDKEGVISALTLSGLVVFERDPVHAMPLFEESVALARDLGDKWMIGLVLFQLGDVPRFLGDHERATALYVESIDLCRQVGDKWRTAIGLLYVGVVSLRQQEYSRAGVFFAESLPLCRRGDLFVTFQCLEGLGCVASARGNYVRAAGLFGAAELLRESLRSRRDREYKRDIAEHMNSAQTALGDTAFASTWAEGRALTLAQAIEYALAPVVQ